MVQYINGKTSSSKTSNIKNNNGYGVLGESLNKYCPSDSPLTIAYMEIYRTDELYYKDYKSPLNDLSSSNTESSNSAEDSSTSSTNNDGCASASQNYIKSIIHIYGTGQGHTTYTGILKDLGDVGKKYKCQSSDRLNAYAKIINKYYPNLDSSVKSSICKKLNNVGVNKNLSGVSSNQSSTNKNSNSKKQSNLNNKLQSSVKTYFNNSANYNTLVSRYKSAGLNLGKINSVTMKSKKYIKKDYTIMGTNGNVFYRIIFTFMLYSTKWSEIFDKDMYKAKFSNLNI